MRLEPETPGVRGRHIKHSAVYSDYYNCLCECTYINGGAKYSHLHWDMSTSISITMSWLSIILFTNDSDGDSIYLMTTLYMWIALS